MTKDMTLLVRITNPSPEASKTLLRAYNTIERALKDGDHDYTAVLADTKHVRESIPLVLRDRTANEVNS